MGWLKERGSEANNVLLHGWSSGGVTTLRAAPLATYPTRGLGIFHHAVGEGKERAAPAARKPPRPTVGTGLVDTLPTVP